MGNLKTGIYFLLLCLALCGSVQAQAQADLFRIDFYCDAMPVECLTGGVGAEERAAIQAQANRYSLRLVTVARQSGWYLAGVEITLEALHLGARPVHLLTQVMAGPLLYLALPPGQYAITARYRGDNGILQEQRTLTQLRSVDEHRQLLLYFIEADQN